MNILSRGRFAAAMLGLSFWASAALCAEPTRYPLTLQNCGVAVTIAKAPSRVVSVGQSSTEILLSLGLGDRMVGTAVWFEPVMPEFAAANARIRRLADNDPSFEAVVGQQPDFVAAQYEGLIGAKGRVGTREQFAALRVPSYVSPSDCVEKDNAAGGDGARTQLFSMALITQEIHELAAIFDIADRGDALVARLQKREADAIASIAGTGAQGLPVLFWFSSREVKGDAFVAGKTGAPAYILSALGARNVIRTDDEWPTVSWESIAVANPAVIVIARMDRRRFPADDVETKLNFLQTDPVASRLDAVRQRHLVIMNAQSMNPTIRTIDGIEQLAQGIRSFSIGK